jgi:tryptophan synthase beta chain
MVNLNRIILDPEEIPRKWYNLIPDLLKAPPPYKNSDGEEIYSLSDIFTKTSSMMEFSKKRWIDIPKEVLDAYIRSGRPLPLIRATRLEDYLKTCAKIYYKCEYLNPVGTFKTNTALPQAYWAMKEGNSRTVFAGSSSTRTKLSHTFSARYYGLTPTVFLSRSDASNNPEHVKLLEMLGADIHLAPIAENEHIDITKIVRKSVEKEAKKDETVAVISSFLNHVLLTQTVIGLETEKQLNYIEEKPDTIVAPVGGGSNFFGFIATFLRKKLKEKSEIKFLAAESETSAKLTYGYFDYIRLQSPASNIFAKTYKYTMESPRPEIMGVGIQTSSTAPLLGHIRNQGYIDTIVYPRDEKEIFEVAKLFLQTEGHLIAPESAYAVKAAIDESLIAKKEREEKVILVTISAASYLDLGEKQRYFKYISTNL